MTKASDALAVYLVDGDLKTLALATAYRTACSGLPEAWARVQALPMLTALEFPVIADARHEALKAYHSLARRAGDARRALLEHASGGNAELPCT
jgi:hypothetical protein